MLENGFFGELFDLNGDGELDSLERSFDLAAFVQLMEENKEDNEEQ